MKIFETEAESGDSCFFSCSTTVKHSCSIPSLLFQPFDIGWGQPAKHTPHGLVIMLYHVP